MFTCSVEELFLSKTSSLRTCQVSRKTLKKRSRGVLQNNSKALGASLHYTNTWVLFLMCRDCYCKDSTCRCGYLEIMQKLFKEDLTQKLQNCIVLQLRPLTTAKFNEHLYSWEFFKAQRISKPRYRLSGGNSSYRPLLDVKVTEYQSSDILFGPLKVGLVMLYNFLTACLQIFMVGDLPDRGSHLLVKKVATMGAMDMHINRQLVMVHTNHCPAWQRITLAGLLRHKLYSSPYVHELKSCIQLIYRKITNYHI